MQDKAVLVGKAKWMRTMAIQLCVLDTRISTVLINAGMMQDFQPSKGYHDYRAVSYQPVVTTKKTGVWSSPHPCKMVHLTVWLFPPGTNWHRTTRPCQSCMRICCFKTTVYWVCLLLRISFMYSQDIRKRGWSCYVPNCLHRVLCMIIPSAFPPQ